MNDPPRRHRKRFSAVHLSSDTTNTLPEYSWRTNTHHQHTQLNDPVPSDRPPDYPDSAEEADADTDSHSDNSTSAHRSSTTLTYVPQPYSPAALPSPSRVRRPTTHRRRSSIPKPRKSPNRAESRDGARDSEGGERDQLDTLLERSVHALEMSNALLQSSMSTQTSLSAVLAPDSPADHRLAHRAKGLSSRIRGTRAVHANWADGLEEIRRGVEGLFEDERGVNGGGSRRREISDSEDSDGPGSSRRGYAYTSASSSHSYRNRAQRIRRSREPSEEISSSLPTSVLNSTQLTNGRHRPPSLDLHQTSPRARTEFQRKHPVEGLPHDDHSVAISHYELDVDNEEDVPQLRLSHKERRQLVAAAPRAMTQYVESCEDPGMIRLPSTLGLRAPSSTHSASSSGFRSPPSRRASFQSTAPHTPDPNTSTFSPRPTAQGFYSLPSTSNAKSASTSFLPLVSVTDKSPEPSTRAYAMLSSFVYRPPPTPPASTPSSFINTSFISAALARRGSKSGRSVSAGEDARSRSPSVGGQPHPHTVDGLPPMNGTLNGLSRSRSTTPKPVYPQQPIQRRMTPPIEEQSSSSSDGPVAKQTLASLRKILDEQPPPAPASPSPSRHQRLRAPAFHPLSPAPIAAAGTSTATASISRLFTKGTHSSSTRAPSPPRVSSLKHSPNSSSSSRASTPALLSPGLGPGPSSLGPGSISASASVSGGSGRNTPKRISFAELPEPYSVSGGSTGAGFKRVRERSRGKGKGKARADAGEEGGGSKGKWWAAWLMGGNSSGGEGGGRSGGRRSPFEDGMGSGTLARNFGPRMGIGGGLDEWTV
ncbi:hypothetical protein HGRIS_010064 [Hohenbuehelia grisea]|uniref:Uncharacterized protein n=1 Tax=Hohenbuehelia grisea TaxID=104357 RepID=A0ABR3J3I8_9AGAR